VYFVADEHLYALNGATGALVWSQPVPGAGATGVSMDGDGNVYVCGGLAPNWSGDSHGVIYAFGATDAGSVQGAASGGSGSGASVAVGSPGFIAVVVVGGCICIAAAAAAAVRVAKRRHSARAATGSGTGGRTNVPVVLPVRPGATTAVTVTVVEGV
jgi:hypothetical protein